MAQNSDRLLAPVLRRLDNMTARGTLKTTVDDQGIQKMQLGVLEGEIVDQVERIQSYGLSSVPPDGGDAVVMFLQGNRDHGMVIAVNDRQSRPKGLKTGEVVLYNNHDVLVTLTADGHLQLKSPEDFTLESKNGSIKLGDALTIEAPNITLKGNVRIEGDLAVTGSITEGAP
jgi:phage baseplate assembly protein V